jgi:ABC-type phosphate transport system substrate-binding protein
MFKSISLLLLLISAAIHPAVAETIVIMGSDTIGAKAALHLAEAYKAKMAGIDSEIGFEISAEGSSTGVVSITEGHADIAGNVNGIGYVGLAYTETPGIKVLPVEGMLPRAADYPLNRTLFYLVDANIRLSPVANDFIGFTLSPQGQHIIESVEFVPIY